MAFIKASRRARSGRRALAAATLLLALAGGYGVWTEWTARVARQKLQAWDLPASLYDRQHDLVSLDLRNTRVNSLDWLHADLESLTLVLPRLSDLAPLERLPSLTSLTLDLEGSRISSLPPLEQLTSLTNLTLDVSGRGITTLPPLQQLPSLSQLHSLRTLSVTYTAARMPDDLPPSVRELKLVLQ